MKKSILIVFILITNIAFSQNDEKTYNHELGLDLTELMKVFFYFNASEYGYDTYNGYTISYRYTIKNINLRAGLGGNIYSQNRSSNVDTTSRTGNSLRYRIGIDKITPVSPRWEAFYGVDLFHHNYSSLYEQPSNNSEYISANKHNNYQIGVAPLFGVRFKLSDRVSLQTEGNIQVFYQHEKYYRYHIQVAEVVSWYPENQTITTKGQGINVNLPINLVITMRL